MTTVKREQRFCLCGWSVYGTDLERLNAFTQHWASPKHKKKMKRRNTPVEARKEPQ